MNWEEHVIYYIMVCSLAGNGVVYGCNLICLDTVETTRYVAIVKRKVIILLKLTKIQEPKYMD